MSNYYPPPTPPTTWNDSIPGDIERYEKEYQIYQIQMTAWEAAQSSEASYQTETYEQEKYQNVYNIGTTQNPTDEPKPEVPQEEAKQPSTDDLFAYDQQQQPIFQVPGQIGSDFSSPYEDPFSNVSGPTSGGRLIKLEKKELLAIGIGGMAFFAIAFSLAIYAKKRRIAAEKARDAIIVDTSMPYQTPSFMFGAEKQMDEKMGSPLQMSYDEKGNTMHSIPIGQDEKASDYQQQPPQYFGSAPTKQDKN